MEAIFFSLKPTLLYLKCVPVFWGFHLIVEKHDPKTYRKVFFIYDPHLSTCVDLCGHENLVLRSVEDTLPLADGDCVIFSS